MPELRVRTAHRKLESGESLRRRRTWHADEPAGSDGQQPQGQGSTQSSKYNPANLEEAMNIIAALEKRVGEREADAESWKSQYNALNLRMGDLEKAQKQKLEKDGNFEELARQRAAELELLKPFEERAKALEGVIRQSNEERIKNVPETQRGLIPVDYPPEKLQAWLNTNLPLLTKPPAPDYNAGAGSGNGTGTRQPSLTQAELEIAELTGMKPEDYAKAKATLNQSSKA